MIVNINHQYIFNMTVAHLQVGIILIQQLFFYV